MYVREQHPETGRLAWVGIGYICDGCGESGFDPAWRERVEEGRLGRTDDEVFWRLRNEREGA